jgi:hypothetical protein
MDGGDGKEGEGGGRDGGGRRLISVPWVRQDDVAARMSLPGSGYMHHFQGPCLVETLRRDGRGRVSG